MNKKHRNGLQNINLNLIIFLWFSFKLRYLLSKYELFKDPRIVCESMRVRDEHKII